MELNESNRPNRPPSPLHRRMMLVARGLTLQEVAQRTMHHPETVRRYMRGQLPSVRFLQRFCAEFGVDANWLLLGAEAPPRASITIPESSGRSREPVHGSRTLPRPFVSPGKARRIVAPANGHGAHN